MLYKVITIHFPAVEACDVWREQDNVQSVLRGNGAFAPRWFPSTPPQHYNPYKYKTALETPDPMAIMEYLTENADIDTQQMFWEVL